MSKELLIQTIMGEVKEKEICRMVRQMLPMISTMVEMAEGKPEEAEPLARRIAERMTPIVRQAAAEKYAEFFTEEQLEKLAAFYTECPWFSDSFADLIESASQVAQDRSKPMLEEMFAKYIDN